ncbi:uncharacterized protein PGTG_19267, partial [Puccinia graminis f. sp. tritici CRL 75-36-700-3]
ELSPAPGLNTAPLSTLSMSAPAPSLWPRPRNPVIHEPTSRPSQCCFATVQLKGMDDDVVGKRAHLESRGSDEEADGSTDHSDDEVDEPLAQQPFPVALDHGLGRTPDFWSGPTFPSVQVTQASSFMPASMFRDYIIPWGPPKETSSNTSWNSAQSHTQSSLGSTPLRAARSPSVELFVPGQVLLAQEVTRWNTGLSTGILWSIEGH